MSKIHKVLTVATADAMKCSQDLAAKEGIFVGITSGATFAGALAIAREAPKGSNILAMLPDTGERYLSTPLFANVPADMTEEEASILRSTPFAAAPPA
jgi:cysteine synthase